MGHLFTLLLEFTTREARGRKGKTTSGRLIDLSDTDDGEGEREEDCNKIKD